MQKQSSKNTYMAREPFNRSPRILLSPPQDIIEMPPIPTKEEAPPATGWWQITIALIMITSLLLVYLVVNHAAFQQVAMLLPLAIMSVLSPVGTIVAGAKKKKTVQQKNRATKRAFKTMLVQIREQLQKYADEQRQIALLSNPAPEMLEARIKERSRLWERRPADPDFLAARAGIGRASSTVTITNVPINSIDPFSEEVRALARDFATINDIPCTIAISKVKSLGVSGARQNVAAFVRSLLCQLACEHSPEDVRFLAILPASQQHDWDWLNDLPYTE
jgi:DNA segregation ATPase FtsK/SpoIIIE, S-DNA-T family